MDIWFGLRRGFAIGFAAALLVAGSATQGPAAGFAIPSSSAVLPWRMLSTASFSSLRVNISGSVEVGHKLTAKVTAIPADGVTYSYQWLRDEAPIEGETKQTYLITSADVARKISVKATAAKTGLTTKTVISETAMVPSSQIVQSQTTPVKGAPDVRLRADAAKSWARVIEKWGAALPITSGWRSVATQRAIFTARYTPAKTGGGQFCDARLWNGVRYVRTSPLGPAAVPGTSNHGAGTAVDVKGFTSFGAKQRLKFLALARDFGWSDADGCLIAEPWHLTYNPKNDKGSSAWKASDPIQKSASHCPDNTTKPSNVVPASACKYN